MGASLEAISIQTTKQLACHSNSVEMFSKILVLLLFPNLQIIQMFVLHFLSRQKAINVLLKSYKNSSYQIINFKGLAAEP